MILLSDDSQKQFSCQKHYFQTTQKNFTKDKDLLRFYLLYILLSFEVLFALCLSLLVVYFAPRSHVYRGLVLLNKRTVIIIIYSIVSL